MLTGNVHLSFKKRGQRTVDDHEDGNGIGVNSLAAAAAQSGGLVADEHPFAQGAAGRFNDSFFGATIGMVARSERNLGIFRSALDRRRDLRKNEIWIRAAEVYAGGAIPAGSTGFLLGLEDDQGTVAWVDSDGVGGLPRPLDRTAFDSLTKTMPKTLRFPIGCFKSPPKARKPFDPRRVVAVRLRLNRADRRALAFDDLQIVAP